MQTNTFSLKSLLQLNKFGFLLCATISVNSFFVNLSLLVQNLADQFELILGKFVHLSLTSKQKLSVPKYPSVK